MAEVDNPTDSSEAMSATPTSEVLSREQISYTPCTLASADHFSQPFLYGNGEDGIPRGFGRVDMVGMRSGLSGGEITAARQRWVSGVLGGERGDEIREYARDTLGLEENQIDDPDAMVTVVEQWLYEMGEVSKEEDFRRIIDEIKKDGKVRSGEYSPGLIRTVDHFSQPFLYGNGEDGIPMGFGRVDVVGMRLGMSGGEIMSAREQWVQGFMGGERGDEIREYARDTLGLEENQIDDPDAMVTVVEQWLYETGEERNDQEIQRIVYEVRRNRLQNLLELAKAKKIERAETLPTPKTLQEILQSPDRGSLETQMAIIHKLLETSSNLHAEGKVMAGIPSGAVTLGPDDTLIVSDEARHPLTPEALKNEVIEIARYAIQLLSGADPAAYDFENGRVDLERICPKEVVYGPKFFARNIAEMWQDIGMMTHDAIQMDLSSLQNGLNVMISIGTAVQNLSSGTEVEFEMDTIKRNNKCARMVRTYLKDLSGNGLHRWDVLIKHMIDVLLESELSLDQTTHPEDPAQHPVSDTVQNRFRGLGTESASVIDQNELPPSCRSLRIGDETYEVFGFKSDAITSYIDNNQKAKKQDWTMADLLTEVPSTQIFFTRTPDGASRVVLVNTDQFINFERMRGAEVLERIKESMYNKSSTYDTGIPPDEWGLLMQDMMYPHILKLMDGNEHFPKLHSNGIVNLSGYKGYRFTPEEEWLEDSRRIQKIAMPFQTGTFMVMDMVGDNDGFTRRHNQKVYLEILEELASRGYYLPKIETFEDEDGNYKAIDFAGAIPFAPQAIKETMQYLSNFYGIAPNYVTDEIIDRQMDRYMQWYRGNIENILASSVKSQEERNIMAQYLTPSPARQEASR